MDSGDDIHRLARQTGRRLAERLERVEAAEDYAAVPSVMEGALETLSATGCWGPPNRLPSSELWQEAAPLLERGSLQAHARHKPHGYAGDFEMLDRIWREDCRGDQLGAAFDRYFQRHAAPQAVRNRTRWTAAQIEAAVCSTSRPCGLVSIGSGPAADVELGLSGLSPQQRRQACVTLLDLDPRALEFAQGKLQRLQPGQLDLKRENLYRLSRRPAGSLFPPADLVVCSGLFDYLLAEDAVKLLRWIWQCLSPSGRLLVMNFAPHNPSRAFMEWLGNWYLHYRTPDDMRSLAQQALPAGTWRLHAEELGIDLIIDAKM